MNKVSPPIFLDKGEKTLLTSSGLFKDRLRSGWKPGHFYLTNKRLVCFSPPRIKFQTQLDDIINLSVQKKALILKSSNVLVISYREGDKSRPLEVWIALKDLQTWARRIYERSLLRVDEEKINRIADELDPQSRTVLIHIWENGHAKIEELAELIEASNHMDVLLKIKERINPTAQKLIGSSILSFEESKIDLQTGNKILFSWWIVGQRERKEEKKVLLDIFDEGDYLNIIMELPGVKTEDILFKLEDGKITISASSINKKYHEEIDLPAEVDTKDFSKLFNNNVLEVKLKKVKSEVLK